MKRLLALFSILFALATVTVVSSPANASVSTKAVQATVESVPEKAAKLAGCEPFQDNHLMCLYRDFVNGVPTNFSEGEWDYVPRNTCLEVATQDDGAYFNDTTVLWYGFNTTTCNGSHIVFYSHAQAGIYPKGHVHAIMRTSTLG